MLASRNEERKGREKERCQTNFFNPVGGLYPVPSRNSSSRSMSCSTALSSEPSSDGAMLLMLTALDSREFLLNRRTDGARLRDRLLSRPSLASRKRVNHSFSDLVR